MWSNSALRPVIIPQMLILPPSKMCENTGVAPKRSPILFKQLAFWDTFCTICNQCTSNCLLESAYYDLKCTTPCREPQRCLMRWFLRYRCFIASRAALLIASHGGALQFVSCQRAIMPSVSTTTDRQPRGLRDIWKAWQQKHEKGVRLER